MKIFGWLADRDGCGYYRLILPGTELANRGHAVWLDEALPPEIKSGEIEVDVIVGQRVCEPSPSAAWQELARAGRAKLVYELDDDLFNVDPSNRQAWAFFEKGVARHDEHDLMTGERKTTAYFDDNRRQRLIENIRVSDAVTVSTEPLAEIVSQWNSNVHLVPNQIPGWLLDHGLTRGPLLTVGWRGGPSHARDFGELAAPLRRFLQHPGNRDRVEFHSLGADYTGRVAGRYGSTRHTEWADSVDSFLRLVDFDIGVIPLLPSTFNESKSDLALLEMSALGIPSITSDTGPYATRHGGPNIACSTPAQWTAALRELAENSEYRVQLGKQAREWATTRTVQGNAWRWEEAYR